MTFTTVQAIREIDVTAAVPDFVAGFIEGAIGGDDSFKEHFNSCYEDASSDDNLTSNFGDLEAVFDLFLDGHYIDAFADLRDVFASIKEQLATCKEVKADLVFLIRLFKAKAVVELAL